MTMPEAVVQGIGFVAVAAFILSYQIKSNRRLFLLQLIGENRQRGNIAMSDKLFAHVAEFGVIEQTIAIHAIRLIDQGSLADNGTRCIVTMVPDERNNGTVLMCECILANYSTISAQKIVLGRPALKIGITRTRTNVINIGHYVFPPSLE